MRVGDDGIAPGTQARALRVINPCMSKKRTVLEAHEVGRALWAAGEGVVIVRAKPPRRPPGPALHFDG